MIRARFELPFYCTSDYRPTVWIINRPYWVCGRTQYAYIMVAYADDMETLMEQWPNAKILKVDEKEDVEFSARFYVPSWYRNFDVRFRNGKVFQMDGKPYEKPSREELIKKRKEIVQNGVDI